MGVPRTSATLGMTCCLVAGAAAQDSPTIEVLLLRASVYVEAYERELTGLVSEERLHQRLYNRPTPGWTPTRQRVLRSDFLMVKPRSGGEWLPFRDVLEVDGKPVAERQRRLEQLFIEPGADAAADARRIVDESARYNLGSLRRNINIPLLALTFLRPANVPRFRFARRGVERKGEARVWRVEYSEQTRPTIVRLAESRDLPAKGSLWLREADGALLRSHVVLEYSSSSLRTDIRVTYCETPRIRFPVPCEMEETTRYGSETIVGSATYSNIRQFTVKTDEVIKD